MNLNDSVVKGVLTIFTIYFAIIVVVLQRINENPNIKNILLLNYVLIIVFFYYLSYLRFRIITMFRLVKKIEDGENFKYSGVEDYEKLTNFKIFSTKGLFACILITLLLINTTLFFTIGTQTPVTTHMKLKIENSEELVKKLSELQSDIYWFHDAKRFDDLAEAASILFQKLGFNEKTSNYAGVFISDAYKVSDVAEEYANKNNMLDSLALFTVLTKV